MINLKNILSGGISDVIEKGGEIADKFITTKQEKAEFKAQLAKELREFEIGVLEAQMKDRDSARKREMALLAHGKRDWFQWIVGFIALASFVFVGYVLAYHDIPEANRELFIHLIGIVEGAVVSIIAYYFGSSDSSRKKDIRSVIEKQE